MPTQALLGFLPDAPRNKLYIDPSLPEWLPDLAARDRRLGKHKLDIRFWREAVSIGTNRVRPRWGGLLTFANPVANS